MATINLFGGSGHAKVVMDIIKAQGDNVGVIYDDCPELDYIHESRIIKTSESEVKGPLLISIGSCQVRKKISERYKIQFAKAIHPSSIISDYAIIGEGSVVMAGAIINSDVKIGNHCIINTKASVDHECKISDYVHIAPGVTLSGNIEVGECSWIGVGACVKQGIRIGKDCMIGAGAVVIKDVPDGAIVAGVPAKIIKYKEGYQPK